MHEKPMSPLVFMPDDVSPRLLTEPLNKMAVTSGTTPPGTLQPCGFSENMDHKRGFYGQIPGQKCSPSYWQKKQFLQKSQMSKVFINQISRDFSIVLPKCLYVVIWKDFYTSSSILSICENGIDPKKAATNNETWQRMRAAMLCINGDALSLINSSLLMTWTLGPRCGAATHQCPRGCPSSAKNVQQLTKSAKIPNKTMQIR